MQHELTLFERILKTAANGFFRKIKNKIHLLNEDDLIQKCYCQFLFWLILPQEQATHPTKQMQKVG